MFGTLFRPGLRCDETSKKKLLDDVCRLPSISICAAAEVLPRGNGRIRPEQACFQHLKAQILSTPIINQKSP